MIGINEANYIEITQRFSYDRESCLGQGSFGKVYKGWDKKKKKQIAVKHILKKQLREMYGLEKRQIAIMQKLKHPNIMEYYDSYRSEEDGLYMFVELCSRGTLSTLLNKQKLSEVQALNYFKQLTEAMAYMNEQKIFHRDLKPDNLLINLNNQLKIADFGTARNFQIEKNIRMTFRRCTPIYSAPEVYIKQQYDYIKGGYNQTCDVFSAGYILYELLTGQKMTEGINEAQQLMDFLTSNKAKGGFRFEGIQLSSKWLNLLRRMLDFNPEKRITFIEVRKNINEIIPSSAMISELPRGQDERQRSVAIVEIFELYLKTRKKKHDYLITLLKVMFLFQHEQSEFIPRIYKLLALYFTLTRYLVVSEQDLTSLHNPETIEVGSDTIETFGRELLLPDRKKLLQFIEEMANQVNREIEQIRTFMLRKIVSELEAIFKTSPNSLERVVLEGFIKYENIANFKRQEYEEHSSLRNKQHRCVKNLFRTHAEVQTLAISDLKIYLTLLLVSKQEIANPSLNIWPPSLEQILEMDRTQLLWQVNQLRKQN